jgi:hypothetical protein
MGGDLVQKPYFFRAERFVARLPVRFRGTFAPFSRASDRPIAIACLRLFTRPPFPPGPLFNVPFFRRRIALSTRFDAAFPYLRPPDFLTLLFRFVVAIASPGLRLLASSATASGKKRARRARDAGLLDTPAS